MKTKAEIVQKLLEEKKIDAEEAVILLMGEHKDVQYIPYPQPYPVYPASPAPLYPHSPIWVYDPNSQPYYTNSFPTISIN